MYIPRLKVIYKWIDFILLKVNYFFKLFQIFFKICIPTILNV